MVDLLLADFDVRDDEWPDVTGLRMEYGPITDMLVGVVGQYNDARPDCIVWQPVAPLLASVGHQFLMTVVANDGGWHVQITNHRIGTVL